VLSFHRDEVAEPARGGWRNPEKFMRTTELFRTCSNEHVASAALSCIGGALERRVEKAAHRAGISRGAYVVRLLLDYERQADLKRRNILQQGMARQEMPILAGLQHVIESALEGAWDGETRDENAKSRVDPSLIWSGAAALLRDGSVHEILHS
jgi:hypothetical protein